MLFSFATGGSANSAIVVPCADIAAGIVVRGVGRGPAAAEPGAPGAAAEAIHAFHYAAERLAKLEDCAHSTTIADNGQLRIAARPRPIAAEVLPFGQSTIGCGLARNSRGRSRMKSRWVGCLIEIVETIVLTLVIFFVVQHFVAQPYQILQQSMVPTLTQYEYV
jgi:hypothetical protein